MGSAELASLPVSSPTADAGKEDSATRLAALAAQHFQFIYRTLRRFLPPDAVEDATQRTFVLAASKIDLIEVGAERAWLFRTAMRVAHHTRRSHARRREVDDPRALEAVDMNVGADELLDRQARLQMLDCVLGQMPEELRTVFVLFELEEMPSTEIALVLEIPVGTVSSRLRRAREEFRLQASRLRSRLEFRGVRT